MKNLLILITTIFLFSCQNEEPQPDICVIYTTAGYTIFEQPEEAVAFNGQWFHMEDNSILFVEDYTGQDGYYYTFEDESGIWYIIYVNNKVQGCIQMPNNEAMDFVYNLNNPELDSSVEYYAYEKANIGGELNPDCSCE